MAENTYLCGLLHPAAVLRGMFEREPDQIEYLRRAKAFVNGKLEPVHIDAPLPSNAILFPKLLDLERFSALDLSEGISLDIESAGPYIICVGLMSVADEDYVCVRFRTQGGAMYWSSWQEHRDATEWLYLLLADEAVPKVMHNGQAFDFIELETTGFRMANFADDTMLRQGCANPGHPKALQEMATTFLGMPNWKHLVKESWDDKEGK